MTPRYEWEPDDIIGWPAALHHWTKRVRDEHDTGPEHDDLRAEQTAELDAQVAARRPGSAAGVSRQA